MKLFKAMDVVLGGDPGKSGCIVVIDTEGNFVDQISGQWEIEERVRTLDNLLREGMYTPIFALVGRVWAVRKNDTRQGASTMFKFGQSYGEMKALVEVFCRKNEEIIPQTWQKAILGETNKGDKKICKAAASKLFPDVKVTLRNCDALLLGELARRHAIENKLLSKPTALKKKRRRSNFEVARDNH